MISRSDRRDGAEVLIAAVVAGVLGYFALTVLEAASMYEPLRVNKPQHSALGTCPDCHLIKRQDRGCSELKGQAWIDCTDPDFVQDRQEQK